MSKRALVVSALRTKRGCGRGLEETRGHGIVSSQSLRSREGGVWNKHLPRWKASYERKGTNCRVRKIRNMVYAS